jgi:hypothetical protein
LAVEEAAFVLSRFLSVFQVAESQMVDVASRVGSSIVELGNNFASTEPQITDFSNNLLGIARVVGFTPADILAVATAFTSVGAKAEAGGTAVQRVLLDMNKAVLTGAGTIDKEWQGILRTIVHQSEVSVRELVDAFIEGGDDIQKISRRTGVSVENIGSAIAFGLGEQGSEKLEIFARTAGVTAEEFAKAWQERPAEAFSMFINGLSAAGDEATLILEDLDEDTQRMLRSILPLVAAEGRLDDALLSAADSFGENIALTTEAEKRYATFESQLQLLKNVVRDVGLDIGLLLIPPLLDLFEALKPLVPLIGGALVPIFQGFAGALQLLADSISFASDVASGFSDVLSLIAGTDAAAPVIDLVPEVDTSSVKSVQEFKDAIDGIDDTVIVTTENVRAFKDELEQPPDVSGAISAADQLGQSLHDALAGVGDVIDEQAPVLSDSWQTFTTNIELIWERHGDNIIETARNTGQRLRDAWQLELDALGLIWQEGILTVIGGVLTALLEVVNTILIALNADWSAIWLELKNDAIAIWNELVIIARDIFSRFAEEARSQFEQGRVNIRIALNGALAEVNGLKSRFVTAGRNLIQGLASGIRSAAQSVIDAAVSAARRAIEAVNDFLGNRSPSRVFMEIGENTMRGFAKGIMGMSDMVANSASSVAGRTVNAGAAVVNNISNAGATTSNTFAPTVNANYSTPQNPTGIMDDLQLLQAMGVL